MEKERVTAEEVSADAPQEEEKKKPASHNEDPRKKRKRTGRKVAKVIIWIVVILAVAFLTLFLASKIGEFETIGDMLDYIASQFN